MRLGVFCGSFAPVHNGHVTIIREVIKQKLCDKVIVVPTGNYWDKKVAFPLQMQIKCLKLFEDENTIIDDDINDNEVKYTFDLLKSIQKKYPDYELSLIMGADNLLKFDQWYKYQYLLDNYHFIVMNRDDIDTVGELKKLHKKDYSILETNQVNVSSTYIREHLNDPDKLIGMIDERVLELIKKDLCA